jgi:hypothetical protein
MANKPNQPKPNAPVTVAKEAGTEAPRGIKKENGTNTARPRNVLKPAKPNDELMGVKRERR